MPPTQNVRALAARAIHQVANDGQSLGTVLPPLLDQVPAPDRGLLQELVFGTCRWYFWLEHLHNRLLERPLSRKQGLAAELLKVGLYQLAFTRIPAHAAVHESVEAADALGLAGLRGLINAILRQAQRSDLLDTADAATLSCPEWLREKLHHNWPERLQDLLIQSTMHPPMTLRVNRCRSSREHYLSLLAHQGIEAAPCPFSEQGIVLASACAIELLPHFAEGWVSVQDESAQLCSELMALAPGQKVLDACAAPGGKTCAMLEAKPGIRLHAIDIDAERAERIQDNLSRLQLNCERVVVAAAEAVDTWWDGTPYERILIDAPCSGTGVIRRHPDIRLLRRNEDIHSLAARQLNLLQQLWPTLGCGGKLVYATCSILAQENSRIVERFMHQTPDAELDMPDLPWGIDTGFGRQLLPRQDGHDGFFYARLVKKGRINSEEPLGTS